ncbi:MAG: purine-nucleoside phosphorylase [Clostridiales bacterium]|nr:purine-nucleoside phosphorylase [Clostridiales bacterium]
MATPHNSAKLGDFAKTVLMPGDPKRAKFIADKFLTDAKLVNDVRGVQGYTGKYKGIDVSVMASGMGMPSMAIYSHELFNFYGVENIIRVGSTGALTKDLNLFDIVLAQGASTDSNMVKAFVKRGKFAPICDYNMLSHAVDTCKEFNLNYKVGNVFSADVFYSEMEMAKEYAKMGVLSVEMEAAALYLNASSLGKKALAILTVSDSLVTGEETTSDERETAFIDMIKVALEVAVKIDND